MPLHAQRSALSLLDISQPASVLGSDGAWVLNDVDHQRTAGPDHLLVVEHLIDCITTGATPIPSASNAIHVLDAIAAARTSAASATSTRRPSLPPRALGMPGDNPTGTTMTAPSLSGNGPAKVQNAPPQD